MSRVPTQPDNERRKRVVDSLPPGTPEPEMDADGNIVGTEDYGGTPLRPEIDANGNIVGTGGPVGKFPPSAGKSIAGLIQRWKNWRLNDLQQSLMGIARGELRRPDQKAQISWVNKYVQSIIDIFPKSRRGRPKKREGPQTAAQRKQKQRQREKDWAWLPFPIIAHAGYLVIESDNPLSAFDTRRAQVVIGFELQQMMDAHHKDYPGPDLKTYGPETAGRQTEFYTDMGEVENVVVLKYPDKVVYILPAVEEPPSTADVLAAALNRGMFLTDAPSGKGKLVTGWGHKKGYDKNKSAFEPGLDDAGDFYADEFANENDDNDDSPSAQPGEFADPDKRELDFGNPGRRKLFEDPSNPKLRDPNELDEAAEKYHQDNPEDESAAREPKCRICKEVLEEDDEDSDDTLLMKHLKGRHPDEYQRICAMLEESWHKEQRTKQNRLRRTLEKQKHCRDDHDGMFTRALQKFGPGAYFCDCGAPLCKGTHVKQIAEELTERDAQRARLSNEERKDTSKRKPAPIYCKYCRKAIWTIEYDKPDIGAELS
jgi:hypothetical protein